MHMVLGSGGTCCCEAFVWDMVCCWMLLTGKPKHFSTHEISVAIVACDTIHDMDGLAGV